MLPNLKKKTVVSKKKKLHVGISLTNAFNPLTYDSANLIALYNGDLGLSNIQWTDQSINGYNITLFNLPTVIPNALNGHQAIKFDGVNQFGQRLLTPVLNTPITQYLVFKQITWTSGDRIISSANLNDMTCYQITASPNLDFFCGNFPISTNPDIVLNTYDMLTLVYNGLISEIRTNNNLAVIGDAGNDNVTGLTIAARNTGLVGFGNIEMAYLIIRQGADSTATQNLFINWLKNRFAI